MAEIPICSGTVARTGCPCRFKGPYKGRCLHHRLCVVEQCDRPRWWDCSPETFCRKHAVKHAARCRHCGDHYRQVVTRYPF